MARGGGFFARDGACTCECQYAGTLESKVVKRMRVLRLGQSRKSPKPLGWVSCVTEAFCLACATRGGGRECGNLLCMSLCVEESVGAQQNYIKLTLEISVADTEEG